MKLSLFKKHSAKRTTVDVVSKEKSSIDDHPLEYYLDKKAYTDKVTMRNRFSVLDTCKSFQDSIVTDVSHDSTTASVQQHMSSSCANQSLLVLEEDREVEESSLLGGITAGMTQETRRLWKDTSSLIASSLPKMRGGGGAVVGEVDSAVTTPEYAAVAVGN